MPVSDFEPCSSCTSTGLCRVTHASNPCLKSKEPGVESLVVEKWKRTKLESWKRKDAVAPAPMLEFMRVEIAKLEVRPGDVVLCKLPAKSPPEVLMHFRMNLERVMPDGVRVVITDGDAEFSVIKPTKAGA